MASIFLASDGEIKGFRSGSHGSWQSIPRPLLGMFLARDPAWEKSAFLLLDTQRCLRLRILQLDCLLAEFPNTPSALEHITQLTKAKSVPLREDR